MVAPPVTPTKTTGYTKIANNGSVLSDDAKLGANPTDWACTKDNKTGLIWEVKTTDGGLRDSTKTYTWDDSFNFPTAVNAQSLCGTTDWRLPTNEELRALVVCSDGKYNTLGKEDHGYICKSNENGLTATSTINTTYFPNTQSNWFWSSSPYADGSNFAWSVNFDIGYSDYDLKYSYSGSLVRLVR